jgi:hypothetical protein
MNAPHKQISPWPLRQWLASIVFILAAQLGLLFWLSEQKVMGSRQAQARTEVQVVPLEALDATGRELLDLQDPTLRALVSARGFSGRAWMTMQRFDYDIVHRPLPPRWLEPSHTEWTGDFDEFVQTNLVFETFLSEKLPPLLAQVRLPSLLVTPATLLRVEGELASRPLLEGQRPVDHPEPLLSNSVVRVLVNPEGMTLSATLLSGSSSPAADQEALRFARSARFAPSNELSHGSNDSSQSGFTLGNLIFQWSSVRWIELGPEGAAR